MKTIIHVNQHNIKHNAKCSVEDRRPVITVKTYKDNRYCNEVEVKGRIRVVYSPDKPLSCGAKVWMETEDEVVIYGETEKEELGCQATTESFVPSEDC